MSSEMRNLLDSPLEDLGVGLRRLGRSADLAHELQRCRMDFVIGGSRFEIVKGMDAPAHDSRLASQTVGGKIHPTDTNDKIEQ